MLQKYRAWWAVRLNNALPVSGTVTLKVAEELEPEPSKLSKGQSDENSDGEMKSLFSLKMYYTE